MRWILLMLLAGLASFRLQGEPNAESADTVIAEFLRGGTTSDGSPAVEIATVPNPLETHLALWLDRELESIQAAADQLGYQFDHAWTPWDMDLLRDQTDLDARKKQEDEKRRVENQPGVLLFRGKGKADPRQGLVILLVPETPTSGVNADAFRDAVGMARGLIGKGAIPVLGPSFSTSLKLLGDPKWPGYGGHPQTDFHFVSGSVVGEVPKGAGVERTVHSIDEVWKDLAHETGQWVGGDKAPKLALLSESDTSYAARATPELRIRYPREISRLRSAYSDQELKAQAGASQDVSFRNLLTFRIPVAGPATDTTPVFAENDTPLSQNAVLAEIARTLLDERVEMVALSATDPFDALFLARYLRDACPNIRLVTLDSDLLWVRAAEDFPFSGTLAVTTYPLTQVTGAAQGRRVFPSRAGQGIFNAQLQLLRNNEQSQELAEYFNPLDNCPHDRSGCAQPPVWITVVSRDGYWPVAAIDPETPDSSMAVAGQAPVRAEHLALPRLWQFLFVVLTGLLSWHFVLVWGGMLRGPRWLTGLAVWREEEGWLARLCYLTISSFALLGLYEAYAAPLLALHSSLDSTEFYKHAIPAGFFLSFFALTTLVLLLKEWRGPSLPDEAKQDRWHYAILALALGYLLFLASRLWGLYGPESSHPNHEEFFFAFRSIHLNSGVSPLLPLLFLLGGFYWWGWVHFGRVTMLHNRGRRLPKLGSSEEAKGLDLARQALDQVVRDALPWHWRTLLTFALFTSVWFYLGHSLRSFEYEPYGELASVSVAILFALLFLTWCRGLLLWWKLHLLLDALERHPIRLAFTALPRDAARRLVLRRFPGRPLYPVEVRMREVLPSIMSMFPLEPSDLVEEFNGKLDDVFGYAARGERVPRKEITYLNKRVFRISEQLVRILEPYWKLGGFLDEDIPEAKGKSDGDSEEQPQPNADRHRLAESLIAFQFAGYIGQMLLEGRSLGYFVTGGFLLAIAALNCYPFQGPAIITTFITLMFVVFAAGIIIVLAGADRNPTLRRIRGSGEGLLTGTFYGRLVAYLGLPTLGVIGAQFPALGRFLFSWVQPMLESLK